MKRITDPVHGSIHLTALEADIVASKAFQRLHNVRQLGLAYYVFPAANYSRFSHSLGACHNASRMIQAVIRNSSSSAKKIAEKYCDDLRLGALLHDLGHYPFSHATEHVVENFYSKKFLQPLAGGASISDIDAAQVGRPDVREKPMNHEVLGAFILKEDPEINDILGRHNKTSGEIERVFQKSDPENTLIEIISSDLDCDRLDYLKRTAHHTGLPYGSVDTDYLTSQATLDSSGAFAYTSKAARAADHLLVSRYYDYLQVPFNKTVAALEWSLTTAIEELLTRNWLDCSPQQIRAHLQQGTWSDFDDNYFVARFRQLYRDSTTDEITRSHLSAILERKPAKTVFQFQKLVLRDDLGSLKKFASEAAAILNDTASTLGINRSRFTVWDLKVDFAKYQPTADDIDAGAVRVLGVDGATSTPLCLCADMLFGQLVRFTHRGFRIFYLPAETASQADTDAVVEKLRRAFAEASPP
jgi:HD superfamily phosphohydrolase